MHQITQTVQDILKNNDVSIQDRSKMTEILIAEAVAICISIPTSPSKSPESLFLSQYKQNVLEKLAEVNELIVIDMDHACHLVFQIWLTRYRMVHCPQDFRVGRLMELAIRTDNVTVSNDYLKIMAAYPNAKIGKYVTKEYSEELNGE